jgi:hypothetical protein
MLARLQSISAAAKAATVALTVIPPPPPQDDLAIERFSADHLNSSKIDERREEPLVSQMAQDLHSIQAWAASL